MLKILEKNTKHEDSFAGQLDALVREGARRMLLAALEAEVEDYVGRHAHERSEDGRRLVVRNGHAQARKITTGAGTMEVKAPRINDKRLVDGERQKFTSGILPPYMRKSPKVAEVLPILYLRGLSTNDFRPALESLLGKQATMGLSASTITRLTAQWEDEHQAWKQQNLSERDYVYVWADGIHLPIRLEEDRLCLLVLIGARAGPPKQGSLQKWYPLWLTNTKALVFESSIAQRSFFRMACNKRVRLPMWGSMDNSFKITHHRAMPRTLHILVLASCCLAGCKDESEGGSASDSSDPPTSTAGPESGSSGEPEPDMSTSEPETTDTSGTGSTSGGTTETGSTTDDSSTTADTDQAMCNNGIVEGEEECDNAQLSFNGPCIPGCFLNVCGDGYQNLEAEGCDEGDQNGMYGVMCGPDCQVEGAQFCGDGSVQEAYEDCEPDEVHDEFDIECQDCVWAGYRIVFVTSVAFDGSMEGGGLDNEFGYSGVTLADYRCQQLADVEELPGTYHAWLSDNNGTNISSAAERISGTDSVAYRMRNGGVVAASWSSLLADGPNKAIIYTEAGEPYPALPTFVWTNTDTHGQPLGADCNGWTIAAILEPGALGTTTTESQWTDADIQPCQYEYPLYCFQGEE